MEYQHSNHRETANHPDQSQSQKDHRGHESHENMFRRKFWVSLLLSIPVIVLSKTVQGWLGYKIPEFPLSNWIVPVISLIVFYIRGLPFFRMSKGELKEGKPGMMTLISMALAVAFLYSIIATIFNLASTFYWELVTLIDVMLLGHWIEMPSVRQASGALQELSKLLPDTADLVTESGEIETVRLGALKKGDVVLIRPGASAPADGEIVEGDSTMDESMITGESKPVYKHEGDKVISGTINGDGSFWMQLTAVAEDTTLAHIMRLVDEAQKSKSKPQILAYREAGWLFYISLSVALITGIAWFIAIGWDVAILNRVASVLVIACPHALGLAIPLVVAISTYIGARNGILIRDRVALESSRNLDTFVFDKTGTLTEGSFGLVDMISVKELNDDHALALAAALERDSEHSIAQAIRQVAEDRDLKFPDMESFEIMKGRGVKANLDNRTYYLGGPNLLDSLKIFPSGEMKNFYRMSSEKAQSVIFLILMKKLKPLLHYQTGSVMSAVKRLRNYINRPMKLPC